MLVDYNKYDDLIQLEYSDVHGTRMLQLPVEAARIWVTTLEDIPTVRRTYSSEQVLLRLKNILADMKPSKLKEGEILSVTDDEQSAFIKELNDV